MPRASLLVLGLLLLAACSGRAPPDEAQTVAPEAAKLQPARQKTVFDEQLKVLDKAKGVQETLDKAAADQAKQIEAQGG